MPKISASYEIDHREFVGIDPGERDRIARRLLLQQLTKELDKIILVDIRTTNGSMGDLTSLYHTSLVVNENPRVIYDIEKDVYIPRINEFPVERLENICAELENSGWIPPQKSSDLSVKILEIVAEYKEKMYK